MPKAIFIDKTIPTESDKQNEEPTTPDTETPLSDSHESEYIDSSCKRRK